MMKKAFLSLVMLAGATFCMADNATVTSATYGNATGTVRTMTLALNRTSDYCAFQADLALPTGTTVTGVTAKAPLVNNGTVTINGTEQSTDFAVPYNQNGTTCRILGYNLGNTNIGGASGDILLTVTLTTAEAAAYNASEVTVQDIIFVKSGTELVAETVGNSTTVSKLWGDVVVDQKVNANDIQATTNIYGGSTSVNYDAFAADINQDGKVNANDIQSVTNIYGGVSN